jgi:ribosomal protein S18 acetylase RimI-like enzyme
MNNEDIKYAMIEKYLEKDILNRRFKSLDYFIKYLKDAHKILAVHEQNSECIDDYELTAVINENWGYVDIYYTKGKSGIYITELAISRD